MFDRNSMARRFLSLRVRLVISAVACLSLTTFVAGILVAEDKGQSGRSRKGTYRSLSDDAAPNQAEKSTTTKAEDSNRKDDSTNKSQAKSVAGVTNQTNAKAVTPQPAHRPLPKIETFSTITPSPAVNQRIREQRKQAQAQADPAQAAQPQTSSPVARPAQIEPSSIEMNRLPVVPRAPQSADADQLVIKHVPNRPANALEQTQAINRTPNTVTSQPAAVTPVVIEQPIRASSVAVRPPQSAAVKPVAIEPVAPVASNAAPNSDAEVVQMDRPIAIEPMPVVQQSAPRLPVAKPIAVEQVPVVEPSVARQAPGHELRIEPVPAVEPKIAREAPGHELRIEPVPAVQSPIAQKAPEHQLSIEPVPVVDPVVAEAKQSMESPGLRVERLPEVKSQQVTFLQPVASPLILPADPSSATSPSAITSSTALSHAADTPSPVVVSELQDYRFGSSPVLYGSVKPKRALQAAQQYIQPRTYSDPSQFMAEEPEQSVQPRNYETPDAFLPEKMPRARLTSVSPTRAGMATQVQEEDDPPTVISPDDPRQAPPVVITTENEMDKATDEFKRFLSSGSPKNLLQKIEPAPEGDSGKTALQEYQQLAEANGFVPYSQAELSSDIIRTTDTPDQKQVQWMPSMHGWSAPNAFHRPLYFEEINLERYGHRKSLLQPAISGAHFFATIPILPYKIGVHHPNEPLFVLGHRRPGSRNPHQLHRIPWSTKGAIYQGLTVSGLVFVLP